jgi:hypothetical protein
MNKQDTIFKIFVSNFQYLSLIQIHINKKSPVLITEDFQLNLPLQELEWAFVKAGLPPKFLNNFFALFFLA